MVAQIEDELARVRGAATREPIDWQTIRGAAMTLEGLARSDAQRRVVQELKRASAKSQLLRTLGAVESAFLAGTPDKDGWPRR